MSDRQRLQRRNEAAFLWQGILFFPGLCFIDANAIVPVFINSMGGSLALAGLISAVRFMPSILAQLFVGMQVGRIRNLPLYITITMAVAYSLPLFIAVVLMMNVSTAVSLIVFLVLYGLIWMGDGSVYIPWYDLYSRVVAPRRRGLILGWQQFFGGLIALLGSYVVRMVLGAEAIPVTSRYATLFSLAGLIMASSAIPMAFVRDMPHRVDNHENLFKHIASFPSLFLGSKLFRRTIVVQALQGVAVMALPILILFSQKTFGFSLAQTAWLVMTQAAGSLTGGLIWGVVSHRMGNNRIIQLNQFNILLIMFLALFAALSGVSWLAFPLAALSGITFSSWMGYPNYIIDIIDEGQRPHYLVMSSLVNLPFMFMPWVAGLLAGKFGFIPVFILCITVASASLALSFGLKRKKVEPSVPEQTKLGVDIIC